MQHVWVLPPVERSLMQSCLHRVGRNFVIREWSGQSVSRWLISYSAASRGP